MKYEKIVKHIENSDSIDSFCSEPFVKEYLNFSVLSSAELDKIVNTFLLNKFGEQSFIKSLYNYEYLFFIFYFFNSMYLVSDQLYEEHLNAFLKAFHKHKISIKQFNQSIFYKIFNSSTQNNNSLKELIFRYLKKSFHYNEVKKISNYSSSESFIYEIFQELDNQIVVDYIIKSGIPEQFERPEYYLFSLEKLNLKKYIESYDYNILKNFVENFVDMIEEFSSNPDFNLNHHIKFIYEVLSFVDFKYSLSFFKQIKNYNLLMNYHNYKEEIINF